MGTDTAAERLDAWAESLSRYWARALRPNVLDAVVGRIDQQCSPTVGDIEECLAFDAPRIYVVRPPTSKPGTHAV